MKTYLAAQVADMVGVPYRTLMDWVAHELLNPLNARSGQRIQTAWRPKDVREASVLANLRRAGFSLQNIKRACAGWERRGMPDGDFVVFRIGKGEPDDVMMFCDEDEARRQLGNPGRLVMRVWSADKGDGASAPAHHPATAGAARATGNLT